MYLKYNFIDMQSSENGTSEQADSIDNTTIIEGEVIVTEAEVIGPEIGPEIDTEEVIEETSVTTSLILDEVLSIEVGNFIAALQIGDLNGAFVIPQEVIDTISQAEKSAQEITKNSESMRALKRSIEYNVKGMVQLINDLENEEDKENNVQEQVKERSLVEKVLAKILRRGELVIEGIVSNFTIEAMQELENWGLTELKNKSESAINSVRKQYTSLTNCIIVFQENMDKKIWNLSKIEKYLTLDLSEKQLINLEEVQRMITTETIILSNNITTAENGIGLYKGSIIQLVGDIQMGLSNIATNMLAYSLAKTGKEVTDTSISLRKLWNEWALAPLKLIAKTAENMEKNAWTDFLSDDTLQKMIGLTEKITSTQLSIQQETKARRTKETSPLLKKLAQATQQSKLAIKKSENEQKSLPSLNDEKENT